MESAEKLRRLLGSTVELPKDTQTARDRHEYLQFVKHVLLEVDVDEHRKDLICALRVLPPSDILRELAQAVADSTEGFRKLAVVNLLSTMLTRAFLQELFEENLLKQSARITCQLVTNLPTKLANEVKSELPLFFSSARYAKLLSSSLNEHLEKMAENLRHDIDNNFTTVCTLFGFLGRHQPEVFDSVVPFILEKSNDFVFRTVAQRLVRGVPAELKENVVVLLCYKTPCYRQMDWLLDDSVVTNSNIKHILIKKLLVGRYFTNDRVVRNVLGYLLSSPARKAVACEAVVDVFHAWADRVLMRHQNIEQQFYLTSALLVLSGFIKAGFQLDAESKQQCVKACLHGVQSHLDDPDETLRNFGMIVGQEFLGAVKSDVKKPDFPIATGYETLLAYLNTPGETVEATRQEPNHQWRSQKAAVDSDDDSEPDDDDDVVYKIDPKCKVPLYLRDCLQLLVPDNDGENVEQIKICLENLPQLIRKNPSELNDIAEQLCRLVLYAEEASRVFPQIPALKREALVLLLIHAPAASSTYLIDTFFSIHVNHRHRMEILSSIMLACDRFTSEDPTVTPSRTPDPSNGLKGSNILAKIDQLVINAGRNTAEWSSDWDDFEESEQVLQKHWRDVVDERISAKTRKIASKTVIHTKENRFGPIAGYFFYPLMRQCGSDVPLKLETDDRFLLVKLLQTLGVVMNSARNTPQAYQMGKSLLQFCAMFRYHEHQMIRQACAFAVGSVLSAVPEGLLEEHLAEDCSDLDNWVSGEITAHVPNFDMKLPLVGSSIDIGPTQLSSRRIQELD